MDWENVRRVASVAVKFFWWRLLLAALIFRVAQKLLIHVDDVVVWVGQMRQELEVPSATHFVVLLLAFHLFGKLVVLQVRWGLRFTEIVSRKEVFTITGDNGAVAAHMSDGSWSVYYSLQPLGLAVPVLSSRDDVRVKTDSDGEETVER